MWLKQRKVDPFYPPSHDTLGTALLTRAAFLRALHLEQKRTERSRRQFVLLLVEVGNGQPISQNLAQRVLGCIWEASRETDVKGWYRELSVAGVIFTEIPTSEVRTTVEHLTMKVNRALRDTLTREEFEQTRTSCHLFPDDWTDPDGGGPGSSRMREELIRDNDPRRLTHLAKRALDVVGALSGILLFSPILLAITLAVKLTSQGPILFRQQRIGRYGRRFTFLKFRSMKVDNDPSIHQEFVKKLISGGNKDAAPVFKITKDPRVTPVGSFLRRTSLDELPQFFNVLLGDMSLVGPRPPIGYEVRMYDAWHKRRFLSVKPGITGLWQVTGRSRVKFDDMVRLDLRYASTWSLWMDLKILLLTPRAVFSGDGAY